MRYIHEVWRDSVGVESSGSGLKISVRIFFIRAFSGCCAILTSPKKRETAVYATIPLCFQFFRCRVDVLQS